MIRSIRTLIFYLKAAQCKKISLLIKLWSEYVIISTITLNSILSTFVIPQYSYTECFKNPPDKQIRKKKEKSGIIFNEISLDLLGMKKNQSQLSRFLVTLRNRGVVFRGVAPADSNFATQKKPLAPRIIFLSDFQYSILFISFCGRKKKLLSIRTFGLIVSVHPHCASSIHATSQHACLWGGYPGQNLALLFCGLIL